MADGPWMVEDRSRPQPMDDRLSLPAPSDFDRLDKAETGNYYQARVAELGRQNPGETRRENIAAIGPGASLRANAVPLQTSERVLRGVLIGTIALLALTIIGVVVFQTAVAPQMRLEQIVLNSNVAMTQDELLKVAGIAPRTLYYSINPAEVEKRLSQVPMVREARVEMRFPNAMVIKLEARVPLLSSIVSLEDGTQVPVLIDALGVAYQTGLSAAPEGLPVLSGVEFKNFYAGLSLPKFIVPFLQDLENLKMKAPALYRGFSEFKLVPVGSQEIEVLAYAIQSPVPVRINPRLSEESALYLLRSLDVLGKTNAGSIKEIDFRTNNVIYKSRDPNQGAN